MRASLHRYVRAGLAAAAVALAWPSAAMGAHIQDIEIARHADAVSILISLSEQPTGAAAELSKRGLTLAIDGVELDAFTAAPAADRLVTKIVAKPDGRGGTSLTLHANGVTEVATTLYRRAVLIDASLARPPSAKPAPKPASAPKPPPTPKAPPALLVSAGLDAEACDIALSAIDADPWDLAHLGDAGLCMISDGRDADARAHLEQLAAFNPEDWRGVYGLAEIARREGDADIAKARYDQTLSLIEPPSIKAAVKLRRDAFFSTE